MYIGLTINSNLKYFDRIMTVAIYVPHHSIDLAVSVCVLQHKRGIDLVCMGL